MRGLPHAFPFRFVEAGRDGGSTRALFSVGDAMRRGGASGHPPILLLEILAQAALAPAASESGEPEEAKPEVRYLAAIDGAQFAPELVESPVLPGDVLEARVETLGSFGRTLKVRGELRRDGEKLVEATLVLVTAPS
jgi:3-hydroxymyristoyl/3-hydroxydecanoyl-(acyl carrier protein) dehydratase